MPSIADLPPMPDRQTGEPRPPKAPIHKPSNEKPKPWHARKVPQPPEGEGPPLEWNYTDRGNQLWIFGTVLVLVVAFLLMRGLFLGDSLGWITSWWVWLALAILSLLVVWLSRGMRFSAGADWVMHRKHFVKTYELVTIEGKKDWDEGEIVLEDQYGNKFTLSLGWVRINEALWDLVYNGIRHSVAQGATINQMALDQLRLYDVLAMREEAYHEREL